MTDVPQPGRDPDDPFPFSGFDLSQLFQALQSQGPVNWEIARQVAQWVALEGAPEPEIGSDHVRELTELAAAAQTYIAGETDIAADPVVRVLGRGEWASLHLDALRDVLEELALTLGRAAEDAPDDAPDDVDLLGADPTAAMLPALLPVLLGLQAGSMVGYLAQYALGRHDLPLPTGDAPSMVFVVPNIDAFESEWSLPRADLRFYLALHESVHATIRSVPWVGQHLIGLAREFVSGYQLSEEALGENLGNVDPTDPAAITELAADPAALLGAMRTDGQRVTQQRLQVVLSVLEGYADSVLKRVGAPLLPDLGRIHEAIERHRLERGEAGTFVEDLLGLALDREHYERGTAFCAGVIERAGASGLNRLWEDPSRIPTPAELDAPGLWLARIDLPED